MSGAPTVDDDLGPQGSPPGEGRNPDDPSSVLTISPYGTTAVWTSELFEHASVHTAEAALASELVAELRRIDALVGESGLAAADTLAGHRAEDDLQRAIAELSRTALICTALANGLLGSAQAYGVAEQASEDFWLQVTDLVGYGVGTLARLTLPSFVLALASIGGSYALAAMIAGPNTLNVGYTNDPIVDLIRSIAMGSDDFIAGLIGIPLPVQQALGDSGLALLGVGTTAAMLRAAGGRAGDAAPIVQAGRSAPQSPPTTILELADNIPRTEANGGAQITVETYTMADGSTVARVLLAGTAEFTVGSDEPWDMIGNVSAVAGQGSTATAAVAEALREAGVDAATPLQLVGFSQGGAQAAAIAMSGDYNVQSLVTFGAPIGQMEVPLGIPVLAVRHTDDLVASGLAGNELHRDNVFEVISTAFAGAPIPTDLPAPAHQFDSYQRTAALMDSDGAAPLQAAIREAIGFSANAVSGTTTSYSATRAPE